MNKTKMALVLSGLLFLSAPITSLFADQEHAQMKTMQASKTITMKSIERELRGYVKAFKADDFQMMQQHIDKLLLLDEKASEEIPAKIYAMNSGEMVHSQMDMIDMDPSQMDHSKMDMVNMDHSQISHGDMSAMSSMEGMTSAQHHQHMMYMHGIEKLHTSLEKLADTQDKTEIKAILTEIKMNIKNNQLFR